MSYEPQLISKEDRPFNSNNGHGLAWLLIILALSALAFAIATLGKPSEYAGPLPSLTEEPEATRQPRVYTVTYNSGVFSPTNLRIHSGDTVRFKNEGIFSIRIVSDLPGFDSIGDIPQGSYFAFTFGTKGTFGYHNEKNSDQGGIIIVR